MQTFISSTAARPLLVAALFVFWILPERSASAADSIPPVLIGCPADPVLNVHCLEEVPPPATVTATDNVDGPLTPVFSEMQTDPNSSCHNVITRTWRVTD